MTSDALRKDFQNVSRLARELMLVKIAMNETLALLRTPTASGFHCDYKVTLFQFVPPALICVSDQTPAEIDAAITTYEELNRQRVALLKEVNAALTGKRFDTQALAHGDMLAHQLWADHWRGIFQDEREDWLWNTDGSADTATRQRFKDIAKRIDHHTGQANVYRLKSMFE